MTFEELKAKVTEITSNTTFSRDEKLLKICELLSNSVEYYNWVGFYFANHDSQTLHFSPADELFLELLNQKEAKLLFCIFYWVEFLVSFPKKVFKTQLL